MNILLGKTPGSPKFKLNTWNLKIPIKLKNPLKKLSKKFLKEEDYNKMMVDYLLVLMESDLLPSLTLNLLKKPSMLIPISNGICVIC